MRRGRRPVILARMTDAFLCDDARWAAVQARDPAADGCFVTAVRTTGIYCRPTCPARPLRRNVRFFATAQDAADGGFRACKRCRP
jgi:AraC family transcriptional regulator, regulatory protein of adaptative response / methylated-DNA-[protein]-cysteine methyltransferase